MTSPVTTAREPGEKTDLPDTPTPSSLRLYSFLARRRRPKSYLGKIMLVAFLGTHVPLLSLFFYAISTTGLDSSTKTRVLVVALIATLVGTGLTLSVLNRLLAPITLTFRGMRQYLENDRIPDLPTQYTDEAGVLMADTMYAITKLDESIHQLKNYDPLTALPNRLLFRNQLEQAMSRSRRGNNALAVLLLDLDGFADINNSLGHENGDRLLRQAAQRLHLAGRESDVLSRIGSDEFAVLHDKIESLEDVTSHSQRILKSLEQPIELDGQEIRLSASIGIAVYPTDETDTDSLISHADVALRQAKEEGRGSFRFYAPAMNEKLRLRLELERELRVALERNELELFYQPQIDLHTGSFTGAEALIRWHHPQRGLVSPAQFIPIAEASGLIVPIGEWVLRTACLQNRSWQRDGFPLLRVAVNLSAAQFQQPNLIEIVSHTLSVTGHDAAQLELEITESLIMNEVQKAIVVMENLHGLGVALALDDFGTGYSSLSYLKRFPLDYLKIDQSFVRGLPTDANDTAITRSIIGLAQSLNLNVIAEGVETQEQADYLQDNGCYKLQGYYFGRPVPPGDFVHLWEQYAAAKSLTNV